MQSRILAVGVALAAVGFLVGVLTSDTRVQASAESCAAPWEVTAVASRPGGAGQEGGVIVLKHNRCTGETFVLSFDGPMLEQDDKNAGTAWRLFPTEAVKR